MYVCIPGPRTNPCMHTSTLLNALLHEVRTGRVSMRPPSAMASTSSSSVSLRPTHFLALRLGSPALHAHVAELQRAVIARAPLLSDCAVPPLKSHLTAFVLHAADEEAVSAAAEALDNCRPLATAYFADTPPHVQLRGLSSFGRNVLYADVVPDDNTERLRAFIIAVAKEFVACGVLSDRAHKAWTPHLTLLKTSRAKGHKGRRALAIRPQDWAALKSEADLGTHPLPTLALCSMAGQQPDGYYVEVSKIPLIGHGSIDDGGGVM